MEHVSNTEKFGETYKKGDSLVPFFTKLLRWIEVKLYNQIARRINWIKDRQKDDSFEITRSGNAIDTNGNFKIERNGENWEVKIKSGGTWTTVHIYYG